MNSRKQSGATLITSLVMLIVLTLLVISAIRSSSTNLRIAGNMQIQSEALAAARQATEQIISNDFTATPAASNIGIDVNNDGTVDYNASIPVPTCTNSVRLPMDTANLPGGCYASGAYDPNQTSGFSNCLAQQWNVRTTVADANGVNGVSLATQQGVTIVVLEDTVCN